MPKKSPLAKKLLKISKQLKIAKNSQLAKKLLKISK
jgi:hypothetical protein